MKLNVEYPNMTIKSNTNQFSGVTQDELAIIPFHYKPILERNAMHKVTIPLVKTNNIGVFNNQILLEFNSLRTQVYWDNMEAFGTFKMME